MDVQGLDAQPADTDMMEKGETIRQMTNQTQLEQADTT